MFGKDMILFGEFLFFSKAEEVREAGENRVDITTHSLDRDIFIILFTFLSLFQIKITVDKQVRFNMIC